MEVVGDGAEIVEAHLAAAEQRDHGAGEIVQRLGAGQRADRLVVAADFGPPAGQVLVGAAQMLVPTPSKCKRPRVSGSMPKIESGIGATNAASSPGGHTRLRWAATRAIKRFAPTPSANAHREQPNASRTPCSHRCGSPLIPRISQYAAPFASVFDDRRYRVECI